MNEPAESACSGCEVAKALSRDRGDFVCCEDCDAQWKVPPREPASAPVLRAAPQFVPATVPSGAPTARHAPRHPLLQLLRDCAAIARWDSHAAPRSVLAAMQSHPGDGRALTSTELDEQLADAADATVRRERAQQYAVAHGWALRTKLDRLHRAAVDDTRALDLVRLVALAVAWDTALQNDAPPPAWPLPTPCDTVVAAGVLEWLVPRAVALSESAHGEKGALVEKDLHEDLAKAFTDADVWAAWHPPKPVPPAKPVLPEPPPAWDAEAWWPERKRYPQRVAAWLAALEDYPDAVKRHERALAAHKDALKAWPKRVEQGRTGRNRHAKELLAIAQRIWFGTSERSEGR